MKKMLQLCILAGYFVCMNQSGAAGEDGRIKVNLPPMMKDHMLGNMRDHLQAVNEIQSALAKGDYEKASDIAETRIGMSSMAAHNASHMAPFMPEGMRNIGTEMHHAASRFAMTAQEGDLSRSLEALSKVTDQCVACHMTYRVN